MRKPGLYRVLIAAVFFTPVTAFAELTDAESASVKAYHQVLTDMYGGILDIDGQVPNTTAANQAAIANNLYQAIQAYQRMSYAIALLVHANPEQGAAQTNLAQQPVSQWVALAWQKTDEAIPYIQSIKGASPWFSNALGDLNKVDRTLSYGSPLPASYPQVIGPHGDYDRAQNSIALSLQNGTAAMLYMQQMLAANETLYSSAGYSALNRGILRTVSVAETVRKSLLEAAIIPLDSDECGMSRFKVGLLPTLRLTKPHSESYTTPFPATSFPGTPYHLSLAVQEMIDIVPDLATRPIGLANYRNAMKSWSDFWRFADGGAWGILDFPNPGLFSQITQQVIAVPFGPLTCP